MIFFGVSIDFHFDFSIENIGFYIDVCGMQMMMILSS
jgi:hypothetical protein